MPTSWKKRATRDDAIVFVKKYQDPKVPTLTPPSFLSSEAFSCACARIPLINVANETKLFKSKNQLTRYCKEEERKYKER